MPIKRGSKHCDERLDLSVCLFVCPLTYFINHTAELHQIYVHDDCSHGLIYLWRHCDTVDAPGFVDVKL